MVEIASSNASRLPASNHERFWQTSDEIAPLHFNAGFFFARILRAVLILISSAVLARPFKL